MIRSQKALEITKALKKLVEKSSLNLNELRVLLALERFAARLEAEEHLRKHLIFKGGFVLLKCFEHSRYTHDIDALAFKIKKENLEPLITKCIEVDLDDGFWFGDLVKEDLVPDDPYGAYRFSVAYQIGDPPKNIKKLSRLHLDIGFGDEVSPNPSTQKTSSFIPELPPLSWTVYPLEAVVAEKLETIFKRGSLNSRAKDIFDLAKLIPRCSNKKILLESIHRTFKNRKTEIPKSFAKGVESIDLLWLKSAWKSVELMGLSLSFDDVLKQLLLELQKLDAK